MVKVNLIVSNVIATYKDKDKNKHTIVGVGLDKSCPTNFKVVATIECKKQIWIELQNHLFMFGNLDKKRLNKIIKIFAKIDIMRSHAKNCNNFEQLYFDTYSKLKSFDYKKVSNEIEHDDKHDVLDFRQIYYFISNKVNSYEN